eukprot:IDg1663t1
MAFRIRDHRFLVIGYSLALIFCLTAIYQHRKLETIKARLQNTEAILSRSHLTADNVQYNPIEVQSLIRQLGTKQPAADAAAIETAGFASVSAQEYLKRATAVLDYRAKKWTKALGPGEPCSLTGPRCNVGLLCVGPSGYKRCFTSSMKEDVCDGVYKLCRPGLACVLGSCRELRSDGELCDSGFPCKPELVCLGRTCTKLGVLGSNCKKATAPCSSPYYCKKNKCKERKPKKRKCNMNDMCEYGLFCDKLWKKGYCAPKKGLGGYCECSEECKVGVCSINKCVAENTMQRVGYGASCNFLGDGDKICAQGLVCSVYNDERRCTTTREPVKICKESEDCGFGYTCECGECWKMPTK